MRKICVVTGTRAEFGLLQTLMKELQTAPDVQLQIIVTGAHLVPAHGYTLREIEACGFVVDETVDMLLASDQPRAVAQSLGLGVIGLTGALSRLAPDIVVLLGDRYEALAAAQAAMILGIPIAHLHGGEATEGLIDEAIRHAITKMAHIHFVAAEPYRHRVLQLGEQPDRVHVVGAMGLDNIANLDLVPKAELEQVLGLQLDDPVLLVTYHPVTLAENGAAGVAAMLEALDGQTGARIVFTGVNADALGLEIAAMIGAFSRARPERCVQVASLGFRRYLSLMALSAVVVGNSSSGLLEAPSMGIPTVNIGLRQRGRISAPSVINCGETADEIVGSLDRALGEEMQAIAARRCTPYGAPGGAYKVARTLREISLEHIRMKRFYDI